MSRKKRHRRCAVDHDAASIQARPAEFTKNWRNRKVAVARGHQRQRESGIAVEAFSGWRSLPPSGKYARSTGSISVMKIIQKNRLRSENKETRRWRKRRASKYVILPTRDAEGQLMRLLSIISQATRAIGPTPFTPDKLHVFEMPAGSISVIGVSKTALLSTSLPQQGDIQRNRMTAIPKISIGNENRRRDGFNHW